MSQNSSQENNPQINNNKESEEKLKKFFFNTENLENVYNILKGEENQLKKETIKKLLQDFEGVEYEEIKEKNKNPLNHLSSKYDSATKDNDFSMNNSGGSSEGKDTTELDEKLGNGDYISFEEFCNIFKNIYESSQNPNQIFLEGFCYMDKDK